MTFRYRFEWDPMKAQLNLRKHGVAFETAATLFHDPLLLSIPDEEHSETEERWISIGQAENGRLLVVVHTYDNIDATSARVRIISARPAEKHERRQYETLP